MSFKSEKKHPSKLTSLIEIFGDRQTKYDETELESLVDLLETYNWDVEGVDLLIKLESCGPLVNNYDIIHYQYLMEVVNGREEVVRNAKSLSENDKLDKLVELCKSKAVQANSEEIRLIVEGLKY